MIPGYTGDPIPEHVSQTLIEIFLAPAHPGFVPQAQFIFAKNCSQVWAEALHGFTQWRGGHGSQELPKEAKGGEDASPYSMDDRDPRKFFKSGERR
ncbi:hypothetical protein HPG69_011532 [Diceros bicornis minor]|uniref:Uncharacterized protein n=1 Tax=Diceros bicornis minor TaxID=77932 RepID=A0A7J7EIX1_DICBM|nr:hypothetical protein HPG69_011532 [Diceros bicornis minor]